MEASPPRPSRTRKLPLGRGGVRDIVLVLGALGGVLAVAAELSSIYSIDVLTTGTCEEFADASARDACNKTGLEQHGGAFILLGLVAIAMAVGASRGASRPAAMALAGVGVAILAFSLLRDLPQSDDTGFIGRQFEDAKASAGTGLYLEIVAGLLCLAAGILHLARGPRAPT